MKLFISQISLILAHYFGFQAQMNSKFALLLYFTQFLLLLHTAWMNATLMVSGKHHFTLKQIIWSNGWCSTFADNFLFTLLAYGRGWKIITMSFIFVLWQPFTIFLCEAIMSTWSLIKLCICACSFAKSKHFLHWYWWVWWSNSRVAVTGQIGMSPDSELPTEGFCWISHLWVTLRGVWQQCGFCFGQDSCQRKYTFSDSFSGMVGVVIQ